MSVGFVPHLLGGFALVARLTVSGDWIAGGGDVASNRRRVGFSQMLRDVLVASLNRGQFPVALMGLILVIALVRISPADLSRLIFRILDVAEAHQYGGWALSVVISLAWTHQSKRQRREITAEMGRLSEQRNWLQQIALNGRIKSSRRKR